MRTNPDLVCALGVRSAEYGDDIMDASRESFICVDCGTGMERVQGVPVLQSLAGHTVHRCGRCGHILLVQENRSDEWSAGWLFAVPMECRRAITCASLMGEEQASRPAAYT